MRPGGKAPFDSSRGELEKDFCMIITMVKRFRITYIRDWLITDLKRKNEMKSLMLAEP